MGLNGRSVIPVRRESVVFSARVGPSVEIPFYNLELFVDSLGMLWNGLAFGRKIVGNGGSLGLALLLQHHVFLLVFGHFSCKALGVVD